MLYKKNVSPYLEKELFFHPTAEYRGTPFWAWNCNLEPKELEWQLEVFKKMGFGGAHMHVRTGLSTEYLGDEFMQLVKACVQKAKSEDMLAWLYDEDRSRTLQNGLSLAVLISILSVKLFCRHSAVIRVRLLP